MMQTNYKYELLRGSRKYECPKCGQQRFVPYVYAGTDDIVDASIYGRCDREQNCGYHEYPSASKDDALLRLVNYKPPVQPAPKPLLTIPREIMQQSFCNYEQNHLVCWLRTLFTDDQVQRAVEMYLVGTAAHWNDVGVTVFWQVDGAGRIHAGKYMLYNQTNGHRVKKDPQTGIDISRTTWAHAVLRLGDDMHEFRQCLFGEHLLQRYPDKPVVLVESEKTAIIGSMYDTDFLWLATGGSKMLAHAIDTGSIRCLFNRDVILEPDAGMYNEWSEQAKRMKCWCNSVCTDERIEQMAAQYETIRTGCWDIADLYIQDIQTTN